MFLDIICSIELTCPISFFSGDDAYRPSYRLDEFIKQYI